MAPPVLPAPAAEEDNSAQEREQLRLLLLALGIDMPASLTDLSNTSKEIVKLQQQINAAMDAMDERDVPGSIYTPNPETEAKRAALSDLQNNLHDAAGLFEKYASDYFGPKDTEAKALPQSTLLDAYSMGQLDRAQVTAKLKAQGYADDDIGTLIGMADANKASRSGGKPGPILGEDSLGNAYSKGLIDRGTLANKLTELGYSGDDIRIILAQEDEARQDYIEKQKSGQGYKGPPKGLGQYAAGDAYQNTQPKYPRETQRVTAQQHLASFEDQFNAALTRAVQGGNGIGPNEEEFARNYIQPMLFTRYNNAIKGIKIGQTGKAYQVSGSGGGNSVTMANGATVSRGVAGLYSPDASSLFDSELTAGRIKLLYEGSRKGAGQFQSSTTGETVARRV